jgi:hypothetical protein
MALVFAMLLASCGADGAPETPGVTLQGDAQIGVVGS